MRLPRLHAQCIQKRMAELHQHACTDDAYTDNMHAGVIVPAQVQCVQQYIADMNLQTRHASIDDAHLGKTCMGK